MPRFITVLLSVFLLVAGGWTAFLEARLFFESGTTDQARFDRLEQIGPIAGLSAGSKKIALIDCNRSLASFYGTFQPPVRRQAVFSNCREFARKVAERNPSDGLAWHILAETSAGLDDFQGLNEYLLLSAAVTAHEAWIADARVTLALKNYSHLTPESKNAVAEDIATLGLEDDGAIRLARIYMASDGNKKIISDTMEELPPAIQRRFIRNLRKTQLQQTG
ncbi:hypothetical protein [Roseibium sp.]|uniref:hypothetical protein n=1 Tax=Roseibium sp. TaxID=1936156 RepID=UPI003A96F68D